MEANSEFKRIFRYFDLLCFEANILKQIKRTECRVLNNGADTLQNKAY